MSAKQVSSTRRTGRQDRAGRLWGVLAVILILGGVGTIVYNQWVDYRQRSEIAYQHVLADLKPTTRIELEPGALRDWNVLLISMDTTRANHLNCYGYKHTKTPVLNQLARSGVLFSHAFTPSPSTMPGHSSLHTGLYPLHHGVRANGTFKLADEQVTFAEIMSDNGYRTGAAISAFVLDSQFGISQGFETFNDDLRIGVKHSPHMFRERAAELTNVPVIDWLRRHGQEKFFFWVHYFDPHAPYAPPQPYRSEYAQNLYDGEIDYTDEQIGKLLGVLDELDIRQRTLVIVVSDHGEGMGQHGEQTHSLLIYDATLHVPMIFGGPPPFPQGFVVDEQVCLVDVMPTVLELLGVAVPQNLDGVSMLKRVSKQRPAICIETLATMTLHGWAPLIGIRQADYKFILAPTKELYNLQKDPLEEYNLHEVKSGVAEQLYGKLTDLVGSDDPYMATAVSQDLTMDDETRRKLEALGYVGSGSADEQLQPDALPDPKEMVYHWEYIQKGVHLKLAGQVEEARKILEDAVQKVPRDIYARQNLSSCYSMMGQREKALATLEPALEMQPDDDGLVMAIAGIYLSMNKLDEAEQRYLSVLESEPQHTQALMGAARIAYMRGDADLALQMLQEVIEINPGTAGPPSYNQIGVIHLRAGRLDQARLSYEAALEIDALNGQAHDGLANVLIAEGHNDEAESHLQLALRFSPVQLGAMATLGGLYRDKQLYQAAQAWCQRALSINPNFPAALNNLGLIYRDQGNLEEAEQSFRKAIEIAPRLSGPHINLAKMLLDKDDEAGAGAQYLAAVRGNRNDVRALTNLATFHFRQKRLARAGPLYRRAVMLQPDYALAHKYLGLIYASVQPPRPLNSIRHLELALQHDPDDEEADDMRVVIDEMKELAAGRTEPPQPLGESADDPFAPGDDDGDDLELEDKPADQD